MYAVSNLTDSGITSESESDVRAETPRGFLGALERVQRLVRQDPNVQVGIIEHVAGPATHLTPAPGGRIRIDLHPGSRKMTVGGFLRRFVLFCDL